MTNRISLPTLLAAVVFVGLVRGSSAADPESAPVPTDRPLTVAVASIETIIEWHGERPAGAMIDIWDELADRLGVTTTFVRMPTFAALLESARSGAVDVALSPMAITEERERVTDLTHSLYHSGMRIAVRKHSDTGFLSAVRSLLSWNLAALCGGVLLLVLASGHLLWAFERRHNPKCFPAEYRRGVGEAMWWITSVVVTGGCDDKHVDSTFGRIIAFAWMIGGIAAIAAFTSILTATLTAEQVSGTIHGPRDLAGRMVGCIEQSVAIGSIRRRGGVPQEFPTVADVLEAVDRGVVEAGVAENYQLTQLVTLPRFGRLRLVGPMFDAFDYGMVLPQGSPLRETLNSLILRMREDGTIERIKELWRFNNQ